MDETEYKAVYGEVNDLRCAFEKAILTRRFGCEHLVKINIAEREAAGCRHFPAQQQCLQLLERMREKAAFALHLTQVQGPLPHAKEMRVQCGGLLGLQRAQSGETAPDTAAGVDNIAGLIRSAIHTHQTLDAFPFQDIVRGITIFEGRRRRR